MMPRPQRCRRICEMPQVDCFSPEVGREDDPILLTLDEYDLEIPASDVHDFYRNVCAVLDHKAEPLIQLGEVRRVMQVMEAAFLSDEKGQALETNI